VVRVLDQGVDGVVRVDGFYCLAGREKTVPVRQARYIAACRKFKRAVRLTRLFSLVPWVRLVALGNIIGPNNTKIEGDIDFFIVAQDKRMWLTRFFCAGLAKVLHIRPTPEDLKDKICLSFYTTEKALDMRSLLLPAGKKQVTDIYFVHWLANLYPIYDQGGYYHALLAANQWLFKELPNWQPVIANHQRRVMLPDMRFYRKGLDLLLGRAEGFCKRLQLAIMPRELKSAAWQAQGVLLSDQVLKFHLNDRRKEVREKYLAQVVRNTPNT